MANSLGDSVQSSWSIEGEGPDRLVATWRQTNGCVGQGIATLDQGQLAVRRLVQRLKHNAPSTRREAARALGKLGPKATSAILALARALDDKTSDVRAEAIAALDKICR